MEIHEFGSRKKYEKVARQGGFRIFSDCESMKCKAIWSIMLETAINDRIILKSNKYRLSDFMRIVRKAEFYNLLLNN